MGDQNPRFTFHCRILEQLHRIRYLNADGKLVEGISHCFQLGGLDDGFSFLSRTPERSAGDS
jgi:hypothetical protein